ncbi:MAG TPA: hypothetical protein VNA69_17645, partial [Thermoanaerobaculia bacterium]|nr:hypothetical protein [Thermoanaerobaculia bacterium]
RRQSPLSYCKNSGDWRRRTPHVLRVTSRVQRATYIPCMRALLLLLLGALAADADVLLRVRDTAGVARAGEVVRSGLPIPRAMALFSTNDLRIVDANGSAVPAQFRVLARWNAGRGDATAPIQWLLVSFPATAGANATSTYRLTNGSNPAPAAPLRVTRNGNRVVVDTGVATFTTGEHALFDESGASITARIDGVEATHNAIRRVVIEDEGPVSAVVIVEGTFDKPNLSSQRRYVFSAGSSTVIVRQTLAWEAEGAVRAQRMRSTVRGNVEIAFDHEEDYEPQEVRVLDDGTRAIDIAAEPVWLSARQALYATFAIGQGDVSAQVDHPLRAWPDAQTFASSDAVDPFPAGAVASEHSRYDEAIRRVLDDTLAKREALGIRGLMTFGLYPRLWGNPIYGDEIDCEDETPGDSSDDLYWCATWTDYHNTTYTAAVRAMRTGEVEWLDEITRPAALRMLYTQIYQCSPDDGYFYCGQAPAGYGAYRADFNSSHAYFDNLQLYYWLTGDFTIVETLQRGARSMRDYLCTRRPASACQPHDPPVDEWANLTGRVASQWNSVFRFVGLASDDASYLDDYRANLARAVTQQYVAADRYGFLLGGWQPVTSPGRVTTDQLWMTALYDMKMLDRLRRDTNDAPIGDPPLRPSEVIVAYARAIERYAAPAGWPNSFDVTWSGARIGGTLVSVVATPGGGDPFLYDTGRSTLAGPLALAATFDTSLRPFARDLTRFAIDASLADGSPLGKLQGEYLARLHAAVAALAPAPAPPAPRRRSVRH